MIGKTYIAIDLKSFYASVECLERRLDPMGTNLVVADASRTEKTICLAVSPCLKSYGVPGRPRLFEVVEKVREINSRRLRHAPGGRFSGRSVFGGELQRDPGLELDYVVAMPRMARYVEISSRIYKIYLKFIAPEDIHVYSIDEVLIDATRYLELYHLNAHDLTRKLIREVQSATGITATAGIGPNLYLCKIAMDIMAKHIPADEDGVRIAELDEMSYRQEFWGHRPLTDFWRVGKGYADRLADIGVYTMGDIARLSLHNEDLLYKIFGVNAELLIDHAWGWEPCTIREIKAYQPENRSLGSGQVLQDPYDFSRARLVVKEMTDQLALDLVEKRAVADQLVLTVGYDVLNLAPGSSAGYQGPVTADAYGRKVPKSAHGSVNLGCRTASSKIMLEAMTGLFDRIVNPRLLVRRLTIAASHVVAESQETLPAGEVKQLELFTDYRTQLRQAEEQKEERAKEKKLQKAILEIKNRLGKNAVLKGMNLMDGSTARERNDQIGGHRK